MPTWAEVEAAASELAGRVREALDAHKHKTIATLRADGSPRISGTEAPIRDGELWLGMMPGSQKAADVDRDPRVALHSATVDTELTLGDAKLSGRAVRVTDRDTYERFVAALEEEHADEPGGVPEDFPLYTIDVTEMSLVRIGDPADHLVIEWWSSTGGYRRVERQ